MANDLDRATLPVPKSHIVEARALLAWMHDGHFVFLGYRHYRLKRGGARALVRDIAADSASCAASAEPHAADTAHRAPAQPGARPELLILTKANSMATVHRATYLDYVAVKTFDAAGEVKGEHRFLGLWTSTAYHGSPRTFRCCAKVDA